MKTTDFRRAVWMDIHRDIRSREDVAAFTSWCERNGVDLAFPCVNHATGFMTYPSDLAPRSKAVDDWDPTAEVLAGCRKAGIESHVWVCIGNWGRPRIDASELGAGGPRPLQERHRDWFCVDQTGTSMLDGDSDYAFLNPARPEVREFHVKLCEEILGRYEFDGYHLDYIRYTFKSPETIKGAKEAFKGEPGRPGTAVRLEGSQRLSFDPETMRRFAAETGVDWEGAGADLAARVRWLYGSEDDGSRRETWYAWKASKVTELVRSLQLVTRRLGRRLSAAVFAGYPWCGQEVAQRWPGWIDERLLDLVVPMDYGIEPEAYAEHLDTQLAALRREPRPAVPMISGIWVGSIAKGLSPDERREKLARYEAIARSHGRSGLSIYSYDRNLELPPAR